MWYNALGFFFFGFYLLWFVATKLLLRSINFSYTQNTALVLRTVVGSLGILFFLYCPLVYLKSYFIFFTASCLVLYTDWLTMLIARVTSIYLVPVGWLLAYHNCLYISFVDSVCGTLLAIAVLGSVQKLSEWHYGQPGLGTGDIDYLALVGAFTGMLGAWLTLLVGAFVASLYALSMILLNTFDRSKPFAFGAFLACAGILVLLFKYEIAALFL